MNQQRGGQQRSLNKVHFSVGIHESEGKDFLKLECHNNLNRLRVKSLCIASGTGTMSSDEAESGFLDNASCRGALNRSA